MDGVVKYMKKHADILRPKFEMVCNTLESKLGSLEVGKWIKPKGGYFVSFDSLPGCAKAIVAKCKEAGITLTNAGATYPYGKDPEDSNIRIAPSFPSPAELQVATELLCTVTRLVSLEKMLNL